MKSLLPSLSVACLALMAIAVAGAADLIAEETIVAYADDFADVQGFRLTNTSGSSEDNYETRTRKSFTYMSDDIAGGDLAISIYEDSKSKGPDEKPGVLSFSFDTVPAEAEYCGFVYQGRDDAEIKLPQFKGKLTADDLKQIKISFRYKATNKNKPDIGVTLNFRFEVEVDDAYDFRVDFGELKASQKWQSFDSTLSKGSNKEDFVNAVNSTPNPSFKVVWGQHDEISSYQDGDTVLIDDLKITVVKSSR